MRKPKEFLVSVLFISGLMLLLIGMLEEQPSLIIVSLIFALIITWNLKSGKA